MRGVYQSPVAFLPTEPDKQVSLTWAHGIKSCVCDGVRRTDMHDTNGFFRRKLNGSQNTKVHEQQDSRYLFLLIA